MNRKKVNNGLYQTTIQIGASKPKQLLWYVVNIIFFKNPFNIFSGLKVALLKSFGASVGVGLLVKPGVNIKYPWKLFIGDHCWIGEEVWIDNLSDITMGNSVTLSQGAMLLTGSHDHTKEKFDFISFPITLEEGAWIGAKAVVFGGVVVGSHSILGINSVAEKKMDPYLIYKGNPAVPVLERNIY
ncbi:MAG TPA: WcaF family extracellular polysaccharide biosynthesis acetyltransferase [Chitinophagaceae bacterium]|jgi:putative colanic acid biosynthesis acetyltransferase WcaF|nr:WcaF family extracellular polysaccharide biosynthesis acetyltransferase [Chitinophagaceae bacterium]